jgi:hypothetical protein
MPFVCRSEDINSSERSQNVRAYEDAGLIVWLRQGGVWDHQSSPLDGETSENMARVFAVIRVAKKSRQKGLGQGLLDG